MPSVKKEPRLTDKELVAAHKRCIKRPPFDCCGCPYEEIPQCKVKMTSEICRRFRNRVEAENVAHEDLHG